MNIRKSILLLTIILLIFNINIITIKKEKIKEPVQNRVKQETLENKKNTIHNLNSDQPIATIIIDKINLKENLYSIKSKQNTIEKHVAFLKQSDYPDKENGTVIILAHSGIGKKAYFKNLDKLELNDIVILEYKKKYYYKVTKITEYKKDGTLRFKPNNNKSILILTTCKPHDNTKQLTIILEQQKSPN